MIQLDKRIAGYTDPGGHVYSWKTQAVLLPNHFFLNPTITYDWKENTCELNKSTYYLDKVLDKASTLVAIPSEAEWLNTYGNDIKYEYYKGVAQDNPSGNTKNLRRATYVDSMERTKYIFEYAWDENDNCVSQKSLAPAGAEAQQDIVNYIVREYSNGQLKQERTVQEGMTIFLGSWPNPDADKYYFNGWDGGDDDVRLVNYYTTWVWAVTVKRHYNLAARWMLLGQVHIVGENGEVYKDLRLKQGEGISLASLYDIISADTERFLGWYMAGIKMEEDFVVPAIETAEEADFVIMAKFEAEPEPEPEQPEPGTEPDPSEEADSEPNTETEGGE